jgi:hypothetical protein
MRSIFWKTRGIGARLDREICPAGRAHCAWGDHFVVGIPVLRCERHGASRCSAEDDSGLGSGEAGGGKDFFVEGDEEAFAAGEDRAVWMLEFGLVEDLAARSAVGLRGAAEVAADQDERLVERGGTEIVDLHVAGHGDDIERAVELAHGFVEESGDDAAVDVAGWALVHAVELEMRGGGDGFGVGRVGGEDEVEALRVGGAAAEAVVGALVDGGGGGEGVGGVAGCVG